MPNARKKQHTADNRTDHVGRAHPQLFLAFDHQTAVERPLFDGLGDIGLGLVQLLAGLDGLLRLELLARLVHLQRDADLAADGIQPLPLALSTRPRILQCSSLICFSSIILRSAKIEQRRGEGVLRNSLGADVLGLHRPEARRRRVLQRETGRRFDRGAVPEEPAERGRHGQAQDPRQAVQRLAEDAVPGVGPQQLPHAAGVGTSTPARSVTGVRDPGNSPTARPCCR